MKPALLLSAALLGAATLLTALQPSKAASKAIRVVVWDEQQPAQKEAYENFLGNQVADFLRQRGDGKNGKTEITVRSVRLDDPGQGVTSDVLDNCDVLVWWGHQRHGEIKPEVGKSIVQRIRSGQLSFLALHSAHWSTPFIEAMNDLTMERALKTLTKAEREKVQIKYVQPKKGLYSKTEPLTPSWTKTAQADGSVVLEIKLPSCVFTGVDAFAKPSHITTLLKNHPIAKGVPEKWDIPRTEIYDGPFHVPTPDAVIFDEKWDNGGQFPAGCVWTLGKGKIFYFRPGHEVYPIFKQPEVMQVVENAVRWLGKK